MIGRWRTRRVIIRRIVLRHGPNTSVLHYTYVMDVSSTDSRHRTRLGLVCTAVCAIPERQRRMWRIGSRVCTDLLLRSEFGTEEPRRGIEVGRRKRRRKTKKRKIHCRWRRMKRTRKKRTGVGWTAAGTVAETEPGTEAGIEAEIGIEVWNKQKF